MTIEATSRVLARLFENEAFLAQVQDDPEGALGGLDLSEEERSMIVGAVREDFDSLLQPHLGVKGAVARLVEYLSRSELAVQVTKETRDALTSAAFRRLDRLALRSQEKAVQDRTAELEQANQRLRELDELKTNFFANINHELRTPLTLIHAPLGRMRAAAPAGSELARDLEVVQRNAEVLLKLVNDLLDLSKLDAGRLAPAYARVDLEALIRLVVGQFELFAAERRLELTIDTGGPLLVEVDPDMFVRVITNLVGNAVKFTPDGGKLRIGVRREGPLAILDVADSGPGIAVEDREAVFERFRQLHGGVARRHGGTGLGLAIVREFVALHAGDVAVGRAREGGALFTVTVPVRAAGGGEIAVAPALEISLAGAVAELRREDAVESYPSEVGRPLVLVVEDNQDMRAFTANTLAAHYNVVTARDGQEGLRAALGERPDLVISDVMMPGMGGDELLLRLRALPEFENTPVVMLTARTDEDMRVGLLRAGAADYIAKPFSPEELLARVGNLIASRIARELLQRELRSESRSLVELAREALVLRDQGVSGRKDHRR